MIIITIIQVKKTTVNSYHTHMLYTNNNKETHYSCAVKKSRLTDQT